MNPKPPIQTELFPVPRPGPDEIIARALSYNPVKVYALYSGGDDSLVSTDYAVKHIPGCEVLHINTGIGLNITRKHVRDTCAAYDWKLTELRAKEDCGQDYEKIVLKYGFPGPAKHGAMYAQLKERAIRLAVKRVKQERHDKVMLVTGIRHDESQRRAGYGGAEITFVGAQMWVNPFYWVGVSEFHQYRLQHGLRRGPASEILGMSGECLCGAFASPGELAAIRLIEPETADYIEGLQKRVRAKGKHCVWEERPPVESEDDETVNQFMALCLGCAKREAA